MFFQSVHFCLIVVRLRSNCLCQPVGAQNCKSQTSSPNLLSPILKSFPQGRAYRQTGPKLKPKSLFCTFLHFHSTVYLGKFSFILIGINAIIFEFINCGFKCPGLLIFCRKESNLFQLIFSSTRIFVM